MSKTESATGASTNGEIVPTQNHEASTSAEVKDGQPVAVADNANPQQPRQPTRMEQTLAIVKSIVIRCLIVYFIMSFFKRPQVPPADPSGKVVQSAARNLFPNGTLMTLYLYLSEHEDVVDFENSEPFWLKEGLIYGDWTSGPFKDGSFYFEKDIPITNHLKNNGSLYLHVFLTKAGFSPNPKHTNFTKKLSYVKKQLNRYKKLKSSTTKNLLTGSTEKAIFEETKIVSHWHPNITVNLVADQTPWTSGSVPQPLDQYVKFTEDGRFYKPVIYINDFWNMARDYKPLNESLTLQVTFQPLSLFKWQLYAAQSMRQSWNMFGDSTGDQSDEEQDTLKETLLDTNPYLLGITIMVSILHSVFELLAFKNDIQFWNNRNSLEGLSVRSVFFGVFQSVIVLLYVLDNETNTLVRISCFISLCIEVWKIWKVVDIKWENGRLYFKDKGSYVESSTREYDNLAFKYLSWLCFPLLAGYSVYALLYLEHKGWYSFVLDLFYGFLLTFGFIMMTPQLFINYKLKSVAHLPWRMLTYKFLNTFIDDMFAFVIKMPTMYRIGCFRDDIVFLVFLYQRWIYPVDKSRRNEFGYTGEAEATVKAIEGNKDSSEKSDAETKKTQ